MRGSSWAHRMDQMTPDEKLQFKEDFLEDVGANRGSKDVHWPMTLSIRASLAGRSSGVRYRSKAAMERRTKRKVQRGYLKGGEGTAAPAATDPTAAPAATAPTAAPAVWS